MRLVEIDTEERAKGYGFMNRVKSRWDEEFPEKMQYSKKTLETMPAGLEMTGSYPSWSQMIVP